MSVARQIVEHTGGQVLLFAPLAVAEQIVEIEAPKFGFENEIAYAADEGKIKTPIAVTNYDRREKFDLSQFAGVILDESSIIKNEDGKTRKELTEGCASVPYLLCASATPAPNDWVELGQHTEFLGVMTAKEMLSMFFVHDGSVRANAEEDWRLKRHAEKDFWRWLASWAVMFRHPRDIGFEEEGYDLPPLRMIQKTVKIDYAPTGGFLFPLEASTLLERNAARRDSIDERVKAAAELVASAPEESWLLWCHLNSEADALTKAIPGAVNVQGSDSQEHKARNLLGFAKGKPRILVSKPKIAGHGMNFQNCNRMIFVGLSDSFEQLFQAVRRCWRFGQDREVFVYCISSELEGAVVANLQKKEAKYEKMAQGMMEHMRDICSENVRGAQRKISVYEPKVKMRLPEWL